MPQTRPLAFSLSALRLRPAFRRVFRTGVAALALCLLGGAPGLFAQGRPAQPERAPKPLTPPPAAPTAEELAGPPAGATKLPSGVSSRLLRAGKGTISPRPQDWVFFFAIVRRPNGTVVQNSYDKPEPARLAMYKLLPAWQSALATMVAGEQRRFWFPAELAPKNPTTGAQEAVIFDLELVHVLKMIDAPASLKSPDPKAKQVGIGAWALTTKDGKGGPKATRQDAALLNLTLWNDLGQSLSTSAVEGRATLFPLDRVMTAFADCVEGMTVGEVRQCWISAAGNEGFPGAPKGALIFELELLNLADASKVFTPTPTSPTTPTPPTPPTKPN